MMPAFPIEEVEKIEFEPATTVMDVIVSGYDFDLGNEEKNDLARRLTNIGRNEDQEWSPPPTPSSNAFIWRYLNFTQLLSILERDAIWFNNVNQFDDPYEGTIPKANLEAEIDDLVEDFDIPRNDMLEIYRNVAGWKDFSVSGAYVNCWNVNEHQSAALWEQYIDSIEGVAIRTTVSQLRQALNPTQKDFVFGNVEYIDYDEDIIPRGRLPTIYHKRESFEHEHEFRISHSPENSEEGLGAGFYAKVDKDALIERVVISPIAPDWFSDLVERVLQRYGVDCELIESKLYSDPEISIK
jgi:hypothetical protein